MLQDVTAYFHRKTESILTRYGPGPRVHYHTGLLESGPPKGASIPAVGRALVDGQVLMLQRAAEVWDAPNQLSGEILDVGCGLGGGSIFWAENFGARVMAVTCVPSHKEWVTRFAKEAGVGDQITAHVCDAVGLPGENLFDAAVAVDSSGYLPREEWLSRTASLLRPGGSIFIIDCFLENASKFNAELFDSYWHCRIGSIDEYFSAARKSRLELRSFEDVTTETVHFWATTLALIELEAAAVSGEAAERYSVSRKVHALVRDGLAGRVLRYAMISFTKSREG
jgi:tocopherol O-methyltransferase